jgi:hypothetical protein
VLLLSCKNKFHSKPSEVSFLISVSPAEQNSTPLLTSSENILRVLKERLLIVNT